MEHNKVGFIRYPGGKQRILNLIVPHLPDRNKIVGRYVEPFLGSGSVFFALNPKRATLSDINEELIDLYRGIRNKPLKVWEIFKRFPRTKKAYYKIRAANWDKTDLSFGAARTLYLNRTCFKGMWRHNSNGQFNVGYGGQDRRWVTSKETLLWVSKRLRHVSLKCHDFEELIGACKEDDFIFVDPPYRPGERDMIHDHYRFGKFSLDDHKRLAATLKRASARGIRWALTTSAHPDIVYLFRRYHLVSIPRGTGKKIGILIKKPGEVLICNYKEVLQ